MGCDSFHVTGYFALQPHRLLWVRCAEVIHSEHDSFMCHMTHSYGMRLRMRLINVTGCFALQPYRLLWVCCAEVIHRRRDSFIRDMTGRGHDLFICDMTFR